MHVYTHSETSLNSGCYIYTFIVCSQIYGSTHVPIIMYMLYVKSIFIFWNYCIRTVNQQVKLSLFSWTIYTYFHGTYISNFREGNFSNLTCLCKQVLMNNGIWHVCIENIPPKLIALHFHLWIKIPLIKYLWNQREFSKLAHCQQALDVGFWYRFMYNFYALYMYCQQFLFSFTNLFSRSCSIISVFTRDKLE